MSSNQRVAPREPPTKPCLILAAMSEEVRALMRHVKGAARVPHPFVKLHSGTLADVPVLVAVTGEGAKNARRGVGSVLERFDVRGVLVMGVSGAGSSRVPRGALVFGAEVFDGHTLLALPDAAWIRCAAHYPEAHRARIVSTPNIQSTTAKKATFDRGDGVWTALDLESAAFLSPATKKALPWLVVRTILDPQEETLPVDFERFRGRSGQVARGRLAVHVLGRPRLIGPLWDLNRRVQACSETLAKFVLWFLPKLESEGDVDG